MKPATEELARRMEHFKAGLKHAGVKLTHQRIEIFRELAKSAEHPDVETIFNGVRRRVPTVSLDTVYRTLWLLLDLGLITTLGTPHESIRFDANMGSHHHFICTACGLTRDFYSDELDHLPIPDSVRELGNVARAQVELKGLCLRCARKKGKT